MKVTTVIFVVKQTQFESQLQLICCNNVLPNVLVILSLINICKLHVLNS